MDKRKNNGGKRPGSGPKKKEVEEKKVQVVIGIKSKNVEAFKAKIKPVVDRMNR